MTVKQLCERMKGFIAGELIAVIFTNIGENFSYALHRENEIDYMWQLLVTRDKRRQGIGREAVVIMRNRI
jgi:hypothetical protein